MKHVLTLFLVCFSFFHIWSQELSHDTLTLRFDAGWNIFSVNITPDSTDIKALFKPLIDNGSLIKIQDENGHSLENLGFLGGWTNQIGDISVSEGYKIKVNRSCQITLTGKKIVLPFEIPLRPGWNLVGYPGVAILNGKFIVQDLINRKTLINHFNLLNCSMAYPIFTYWCQY